MIEHTEFMPDWISPPGETIEDILEERGWSKAELAERTGFTPKHVNELIKGRAPISPDAAERLSLVLGSTAEFWLMREAQYQAALSRRRIDGEAEVDADWLEELPVSWMRKHAWIKAYSHRGAQVLELFRFFEVWSVSAWRSKYEQPLAAFRASSKFEKKVGAIAAWLKKAESEATLRECEPFDKDGFKAALRDLRALTCEPDPSVFVPRMIESCAAHGVAVVFVPAPPGCPASGATRWLTPDKAMLVLSLRHRTNDHLWFTFFHEAAHILLHGKKLLFIENINGLDEDHEDEANRFARDLLIPREHASRLPMLKSQAQVVAFAKEVGIAPGIVVGRLHKDGLLRWDRMNELKVKYEWAGEQK